MFFAVFRCRGLSFLCFSVLVSMPLPEQGNMKSVGFCFKTPLYFGSRCAREARAARFFFFFLINKFQSPNMAIAVF